MNCARWLGLGIKIGRIGGKIIEQELASTPSSASGECVATITLPPPARWPAMASFEAALPVVVERRRRLVEQPQRRRCGEQACQSEPSALPGR